MTYLRYLSVSVIILFSLSISFGYGQRIPDFQKIEASRSGNCEYVAAIVDSFVGTVDNNQTLLIVATKGKGESKSGLSDRRARTLQKYLTVYHQGTGLSLPGRSVLASVSIDYSDTGRIDTFVDGKLSLTIEFRNNRELRLSPCYIGKSVRRNKK